MNQPKRDIKGNVIVPDPKCMNCGRDKGRQKPT